MIEELEIDGYRLLHGFKADLKALNVVVGAKATGKSSLIDCLRLISYCCRLPISAAFDQFDHPTYLLSADSEADKVRWKVSFRGRSRDFVYEATFKPDRQGRVEIKHEMLRYRDADNGHDSPLKLLEATPLHEMVFDRAKRELVPFDDGGEADGSVNMPPVAELKDQAGSVASQEPMQEVSSLLSQMQQFPNRSLASALKHDLEMLLLATGAQLREILGGSQIGKGTPAPENQNQATPPKKLVKQLFLSKTKRSYRETVDAPAILRRACLRDIASQCPKFKEMLDWVGEKTGALAY